MSIRNDLLENILTAINGGAEAAGTGWAQYSDTQYTSASPLTVAEGNTAVITNNAVNSITTHLPAGVTALYDPVTNKITPENSGDAYMIRVDFTAFSSNQSGLATLELDIGAPQNEILRRGFTFPKGAGLSNAIEVSTSSLIYTLDTFIANGGSLELRSDVGNTSIFDIGLVISRIHNA